MKVDGEYVSIKAKYCLCAGATQKTDVKYQWELRKISQEGTMHDEKILRYAYRPDLWCFS